VSRVTLRKALHALEAEGVLTSAQRAGWHVLPDASTLGYPAETFGGITGHAKAQGRTATARVLLARPRPASFEEAERLAMQPGAEVFELDRVVSLDGLVVSHSHSLVPARLAPGLDELDFTSASLFQALEERGAAPRHARHAVYAALVTPEDAELLELEPGAPVLHTETLHSDGRGRPCDLNRAVYRADRFRFHAELPSPAPIRRSPARGAAPPA
ncbi:GntR family transcriptional regulator, partial [Streptomyces sp. T-3]|nr:GntR family transcriptional regulator [Streptomyces sp. T-3]